ncbi:hypothetical protein [Segetibacter aerophilus]|uniref:Uncharacterized protein n=1 Tax=Segetibacter aerophilus TaxID=670293 RepID=A0A512BAV9_9BACT|nr:hypothetical protein [Segetibacter aerophilus]GEO09091.1 hypothetical protein SAE01_15870 [Segetibacter aerophilus]
METEVLENVLPVFGFQVKTFPMGIKEAFDELTTRISAEDGRFYYGISECTKDGIVYIAAAAEKFEGEGDQYGYQHFLIEKGEYLAVTVLDWLCKTDSIKDVFVEMFTDARADRSKPCVEIYKSDDEMVCLVKTLEARD